MLRRKTILHSHLKTSYSYIGDVTCPEGLILNHSDPSECFVLFSITAPIADIYSLNDSPSWVGAPMLLSIQQPHVSIYSKVSRLLEDKALEEGEEYRFIPIEPLEPKGDGGPQPHSTPKKKAEPMATVLAEQFIAFRITGPSTNPVCNSVRNEEQAGCFHWPLFMRCHPSYRLY